MDKPTTKSSSVPGNTKPISGGKNFVSSTASHSGSPSTTAVASTGSLAASIANPSSHNKPKTQGGPMNSHHSSSSSSSSKPLPSSSSSSRPPPSFSSAPPRTNGAPAKRGTVRQFRRQDHSGAKEVEEDFRIQAEKALIEFRNSEDETITFPSTLTNTERKYVHYLCNNMGLVSKSSGKGENRQLHVRRKTAKDIESIHHPHVPKHPELFLGSATEIIEYFRQYPLTTDDWTFHSLTDNSSSPSHRSSDYRSSSSSSSTHDWWHQAMNQRTQHPDYPAMLTNRKTLPAWRVQENVVAALRNHQIIIVSGDTGCGKSTQIPQFILDSVDYGPSVNMIVTQPRRISAITLAERVAAERCEEIGRFVGYNVRLESNVSKDTRLLFVTTGVLLRMLVNDPQLKDITHICIDEVHERDINSDFLLIITRDLLVHRPDIRIVIMSATLQLELFTQFFTQALQDAQTYHRQTRGLSTVTMMEPVPAVIHVAGSTFPVTRYYLEDILLHTGYANHLVPPSSALNDLISSNGNGGGGIHIPTSLPERTVVDLGSSNAFTNGSSPSSSFTSMLLQQNNHSHIASSPSTSHESIPSPVLQGKSSSLSSPTVVAGLVCALCGQTKFANVEDFAMHAAFCTGEPPAHDGTAENTVQTSSFPSSSNESIVPSEPSQSPPSTVGISVTASPSLLVSPSGTVRSKGIVLPGGAKAKLLEAMQKNNDNGNLSLSTDPSPSLSGTLNTNGPVSPIADEIEKLVDTYQKGLDEEEIDISLLMNLLNHIVDQSLATTSGNQRGNPASVASSIALPSSHSSSSATFDQHTGGRTPADTGLGAVLVFLPGWEEISQVMELMRAHTLLGNPSKVLILPLHSQVPSSEQRRAFRRPPPGVVKVILSTNIAETSVTIDDVVYVIDAGKVREKSYDPYTGCSRLASVWISQASARQRAGRAGRVRPGIAYHLFSKRRHQSMNEFTVPEMLRMPLDELCLQIKLLKLSSNLTKTKGQTTTTVTNDDGTTANVSEISQFLARAVQPPPPNTVKAAIELLHAIGALRYHKHSEQCYRTASTKPNPSLSSSPSSSLSCGMHAHEDELTLLGKRLANLPMSPRLGKMLLLAILFRCLDPILTITCAMSFRPPWLLPMFPGEKIRADKARFGFAHYARSDHMSLLGAFQSFHEARRRGGNAPFNSVEQQFCREYFISAPAMNMITAMRGQLTQELYQAGCFDAVRLISPNNRFFSPGVTDAQLIQYVSSCSTNSHNNALVTSILAAGLYPNIGRNNPSMGTENVSTKLQTRTTRKAIVHFSSINSMMKDPKNRNSIAGGLAKASTTQVEWVCFDEMSNIGSRGTIALRGTTVVHPLALLLLSTVGKVAGNDGKHTTATDDTYDTFIPGYLNAVEGKGKNTEETLRELEDVINEQLRKNKTDNDDDNSDIESDDDSSDSETGENNDATPKNTNKKSGSTKNTGNDPSPIVPHAVTTSTVKGFKPYLIVDDWISFTLQPSLGILLTLLRNRLVMAFHRLIINPSSSSQRKNKSHGSKPSASLSSSNTNLLLPEPSSTDMDHTTVDLVLRLLTNETYGASAKNIIVASVSGNTRTSTTTTTTTTTTTVYTKTTIGNTVRASVRNDDIATIAEIVPITKTATAPVVAVNTIRSTPTTTTGLSNNTHKSSSNPHSHRPNNHKPLTVVIPPPVPNMDGTSIGSKKEKKKNEKGNATANTNPSNGNKNSTATKSSTN